MASCRAENLCWRVKKIDEAVDQTPTPTRTTVATAI
jgi:hypothetical protein